MRWSLRIGTVAGIGIFVHWSFLLIIGWIVFIYMARGEGAGAAAEGVLFVLALFGCVVLHELGHALTARRYNIPTRDITLLPIGGVARLERMPEEPGQEFRVAIAGPAVNVAIAAVLAALIALVGEFRPFGEIVWFGGGLGDFWLRLMWFNLILVFFNLLPAFPMDGGRVLRSLLARRLDFVRATRIAASVGQGMAIFFGFLGLISFNPFLVLIAFFVYMGAQVESNSAQVTALIRGLEVRDAMMKRFRTLSEEDDLAVAVEQLLAGSQQEFPVLREGRVVGLLARRDLVEALAERGRSAKVAAVMQADYPVVEEKEPLEEVFHKMLQEGLATLPVVRDGEMVGLLSTENVGELVMINSAIKRRRDARGTVARGF
jgi:Zn-dependent protease/predicted transcriptional regulator